MVTKETLAILKAGRRLLSDQSRWTYGAYARAKSGSTVNPDAPDAYRFCAIGMARHVGHACKADDSAIIQAEIALHDATSRLYGRPSVVTLNDDTRYGRNIRYMNVLFAYEEAIEHVKGVLADD